MGDDACVLMGVLGSGTEAYSQGQLNLSLSLFRALLKISFDILISPISGCLMSIHLRILARAPVVLKDDKTVDNNHRLLEGVSCSLALPVGLAGERGGAVLTV